MRGRGPRKILLVEDDDAIRALIVDVLDEAGFAVHPARSGNDGLARVKDIGPDLIILDKLMPDGDGTTFAREYRARRGPHAPIIALSAAADAGDWATQIGAAAYVGKPLDIEDLLATVKGVLAKAEP
jgi:DNA-binding response OmpR family regulator